MPTKDNRYYADILPGTSSTAGKSATKTLIERAQNLRERYADRDEKLDDVESYYYQTGVSKADDGEIYHVNVSDGQSAVDLMADLLSGQEINVIVPAMSDTRKAKTDADDLERWLMAWFKMSEREEDMQLVHELAQDIIMRGALVIRALMLDERLPKNKNGKYATPMKDFPLVPEVRDFRYCYPVYKRTKLQEVFECYECTVGDIKIDWPDLKIPKNWNDDDEVQMWEWWSCEKKAFWIEGTTYYDVANEAQNVVWLMKPVSHGYGVLPYSIRAMRPQGKKRNDPTKMAPSLLQSWAGTLEAMNLVESAKFTAGMSYINSAWVVYTNRTDFDLDLTHGAVNYLYPDKDERVQAIVKNETPVDLMQISGEWAAKFQRASIPSALYGENIGPNMAGYAIALLNESGRRILIPIVNAIENALADICGIALAISENLLGPTLQNYGHDLEIYVTHESDDKRQVRKGVKLDWEGIDGAYMTEVSLGDPMPQDQERNMNMAIAARQPDATGMPLLSDESIRTDILKLPDNERELSRILQERLMTEAAMLIAQEQAVEGGLVQPEEGMMPPPEMMPPGMEGQMPPEMMAQGGMPPGMEGMMPPGMPPPSPDPVAMQAVEQLAQKIAQIEEVLMQLLQSQAPMAPPEAMAQPAMPPEMAGMAPGMEGMMPNEEIPVPAGPPPAL
jgi:hypothetical protein